MLSVKGSPLCESALCEIEREAKPQIRLLGVYPETHRRESKSAPLSERRAVVGLSCGVGLQTLEELAEPGGVFHTQHVKQRGAQRIVLTRGGEENAVLFAVSVAQGR